MTATTRTFLPTSKYFILIFFGSCFFLLSTSSSSSSYEGPSNEKSSGCPELECDSFCFNLNLNFAKCVSDVFLLVNNDALQCLRQIACRASSKCSFNVIHLKNEGEKLVVMEGKTYQHLTFSNEFHFLFFFLLLPYIRLIKSMQKRSYADGMSK